MEEALLEASENGKYPIVVDTSPCLAEIKGSLQNPALRFSLYEPAEFIANHLLDKLEFNKVKKHVAIHVRARPKARCGTNVHETRRKVRGRSDWFRHPVLRYGWRPRYAISGIDGRFLEILGLAERLHGRLLHLAHVRDEFNQPL